MTTNAPLKIKNITEGVNAVPRNNEQILQNLPRKTSSAPPPKK